MKSLSELSPITERVRQIFHWAKWLSPQRWLSGVFPLLKSRNMLTPNEVNSKSLKVRRARVIEYYVIVWFTLIVVLFALTCLWPLTGLPPHWLIGPAVIGALRIIEIVQVTVNVTLFDRLSGRPDDGVASSTRVLTLAGINFVELLLCFAVVYASDYCLLKGAESPLDALYFSVITQLTIGYGEIFPTGWLRVVVATQGLVGLLFVLLVFGRFVASLPPLRGILEENLNKLSDGPAQFRKERYWARNGCQRVRSTRCHRACTTGRAKRRFRNKKFVCP